MKNLICLGFLFSSISIANASYEKITDWGHVAGAATILNTYTADPLSSGTPSALGVTVRICVDIGRLTGRVDDLVNKNAGDTTAKRIHGISSMLEIKCANDERKESFTAEEVTEIQKSAERIIELVYSRKR